MPEQDTKNVALYVACPGCVSFSAVESRDGGRSIAKSHNGSHDDDIATTINVRDESELREFVQEVKEHAPGDEYRNFVRRLSKGNSAFFCSARMFREVVPDEDRFI
jgi:hypothetical protein